MFMPGCQCASPAARAATMAVDRECRRFSTVIFSRAVVSPSSSQRRCSAVMEVPRSSGCVTASRRSVQTSTSRRDWQVRMCPVS